ncbi:MAG: AraC family transcriptional regulator [Sphingobacterium sp.]|jgi:AraC-like DNA-binding protein|nr:AraC family transcriptional regulator [Sphingobacterium sp.]
MDLRLNNNEQDRILAEKEFAGKHLVYEEGITEVTTSLEEFFGNGFYREIYFDGVRIGFGNSMIRNAIQLDFENDVEMVEMHFALRGKSISATDRFDKGTSFLPNQHNIIYTNGISGNMKLECAHYQRCEVNLNPLFFKKFFPQDSQLMDKFREEIEKGTSRLLSPCHNPMSHKMYELIYEIMNCQRRGVFKRIFLEAKVIELLLLQLEQFSDDREVRCVIKKREEDKVHAVREFILQNLDANHSLIELAHQVGTNEFVLKKGFKSLFGTTVFSFWNDAKMEQAKKLLIESDLNISEVADLIGYKNQRHFSSAFKKKFGMLPSIYKK